MVSGLLTSFRAVFSPFPHGTYTLSGLTDIQHSKEVTSVSDSNLKEPYSETANMEKAEMEWFITTIHDFFQRHDITENPMSLVRDKLHKVQLLGVLDPFRSPLLRISQLFSSPPLINMLKFSGFYLLESEQIIKTWTLQLESTNKSHHKNIMGTSFLCK